MSTLSVSSITGVTTLSGSAFDAIGTTANTANVTAIAAFTQANNVGGAVTTANNIAIAAFTQANTIVPGTILATPNTTTPSGYLLCDGSAYLQSSYPALAAVSNVATLAGTYLANLRSLTSSLSGTVYGSPGTLAATSDGLLFYDAGASALPNAYVSLDSGATWTTMRANSRPLTTSTNRCTIAYNGTNYVTGNTTAFSDHSMSRGARYGSNVFTLSGQTTTNINKVLTSIVWTGTYFVAVGGHQQSTAGQDANVASYSTDGITWTQGGAVSNLSSAAHPFQSGYEKWLAYGNNTLVVVAANTVSATNNYTSTIMRYSTDNAVSWTTATQPSGFGVNSPSYTQSQQNTLPIIVVTYANNQFVAVDFAGAVANSPNGIVWRVVAPAATLTRPSPTAGLTNGLYRSYTDNNPHLWSQGVSYTSKANGYYILSNQYSRDLVTWKRFPMFAGTQPGSSIPAGSGVVQPTSNNYFYTGIMLQGDGGCGNQNQYTDCGYLNLTPNPNTQFSVPYLTDEQTGMVKYYIKT